MTDSNNVVLEQLRIIRNDIAEFRTETRDRFARLELRMGLLEQRLGGIELRLADAESAHQKRLERIEKRLELTD